MLSLLTDIYKILYTEKYRNYIILYYIIFSAKEHTEYIYIYIYIYSVCSFFNGLQDLQEGYLLNK